MKIADIVKRQVPPMPWTEGEKIPWHEPGFSTRMLQEHLSQDHDAASRRVDIVHRQVDYLERFAGGATKALKVLDLACGPGLHALEFARRGHSCRGIDFSPASIAWAQEQTTEQALACTFALGDIRTTAFSDGFDLVVLLFGEMNVFSRADLSLIVGKARHALGRGGALVLEPHLPGVARTNFVTRPTWSAQSSGLFSDRPHMLLEEGFWHDDVQMAVKRWYVIDAATGDASVHSQTVVEYTRTALTELVEAEGFRVLEAPAGWPIIQQGAPAQLYPFVAIRA